MVDGVEFVPRVVVEEQTASEGSVAPLEVVEGIAPETVAPPAGEEKADGKEAPPTEEPTAVVASVEPPEAVATAASEGGDQPT